MPETDDRAPPPPAPAHPQAIAGELAELLSRARDPARPPRGRRGPPGARLAGAVFFLLVGVALALVLAFRLRAAPGPAAAASPGTLLRPLEPARDAATGEETAPFSGFAVSVETVPPGALVTVAGVARGEAPVFAGVACAPGERVEVRAERAGLAAARATTCRADTLVKLTLRLAR